MSTRTSRLGVSSNTPTSTESQNIPIRDSDLIFPDEHLTESTLDDLWSWFAINKDVVDPQLVFVKLINSARKPYITNRVPNRECSKCKRSDEKVQELQVALEKTKRELETVQSRTEPQEQAISFTPIQHNVPVSNEPVEPVQLQLTDISANSTSKSLNPKVCIAIRSAYNNKYLSMKNVTSAHRSCSELYGLGITEMSDIIGGEATFELYNEDSNPDVFAFKSNLVENIYLRVPSHNGHPGEHYVNTQAYLNFQYSCGKQEQFRIHATGFQGLVAIESVAYPGTFLSAPPSTTYGTMQGIVTDMEEWILVVVPSWRGKTNIVGRTMLQQGPKQDS